MYLAVTSQNVVGASIAVVGVGIGGLLTFAGNLLLDRRREKHDARAAAELFLQEVEDALSALSDGIEKGDWPLGWKPWSQTWESYRAAAALRWRSADFTPVAKAYAHMYGLDHGLRDGHEGDRKFKGDDMKFFKIAKEDLDRAHQRLRKLAATAPTNE